MGWGVTARGLDQNCDWKLHGIHDDDARHNGASKWSARRRDSSNDVTDRFSVLWGPDNSGNVYNPDVIASVVSVVSNSVPLARGGVDLVVADGGFSGARDRGDQADVTYRLVLCQLAIALQTVRLGGAVICKLFDTHTTHMAVLLLRISQVFQHVALIKPLTSRPASSERYLVCMHLLHPPQDLVETLLAVNSSLGLHPMTLDGVAVAVTASSSSCDYLYAPTADEHVTPPSTLLAHPEFSHWLSTNNER
jgi:23S rRNA U2552 (ribose-2'-O)-methylase RlmE/FtsJ